MYKIKTYNKISKIGLEIFDDKYTIGDEVENADGAIVRSAALHDEEFPASLKAIARAGAGVNNIPIDRCSEKGIVVFNTQGANANAVKELVITGQDEKDKRIKKVRISDKGLDLIMLVCGHLEESEDDIIRGFFDKDQETFHSLLERAYYNVVERGDEND